MPPLRSTRCFPTTLMRMDTLTTTCTCAAQQKVRRFELFGTSYPRLIIGHSLKANKHTLYGATIRSCANEPPCTRERERGERSTGQCQSTSHHSDTAASIDRITNASALLLSRCRVLCLLTYQHYCHHHHHHHHDDQWLVGWLNQPPTH
jgi:hypothetical protein